MFSGFGAVFGVVTAAESFGWWVVGWRVGGWRVGPAKHLQNTVKRILSFVFIVNSNYIPSEALGELVHRRVRQVEVQSGKHDLNTDIGSSIFCIGLISVTFSTDHRKKRFHLKTQTQKRTKACQLD